MSSTLVCDNNGTIDGSEIWIFREIVYVFAISVRRVTNIMSVGRRALITYKN